MPLRARARRVTARLCIAGASSRVSAVYPPSMPLESTVLRSHRRTRGGSLGVRSRPIGLSLAGRRAARAG
jgi:hypothetical protein